MFCSQCGTANADGSQFCSKCGASLGGSSAPGAASSGMPMSAQPFPARSGADERQSSRKPVLRNFLLRVPGFGSRDHSRAFVAVGNSKMGRAIGRSRNRDGRADSRLSRRVNDSIYFDRSGHCDSKSVASENGCESSERGRLDANYCFGQLHVQLGIWEWIRDEPGTTRRVREWRGNLRTCSVDRPSLSIWNKKRIRLYLQCETLFRSAGERLRGVGRERVHRKCGSGHPKFNGHGELLY